MGYTGYSTDITPSASNDANFRIWGNGISNFFTSCSWVTESTVTNAISWVTAVRGAAAVNGAKSGFEVWKMNDGFATGSLANIYVRIDYGVGSNNNTNAAMWITMGTSCTPLGIIGSSNGGAFGPVSYVPTYNPPATFAPVFSYVSGDPSRIGMLLYGSFSGVFTDILWHQYINIERLKDTNGNDTANGYHICLYGVLGSAGRNLCYNILHTGSAYGPSGVTGPEVHYKAISSTVANYGFQIGAGLHYPIVGNVIPPILGSVALNTNDGIPFNILTIPIYGVNHSYMSIKNTGLNVTYALCSPFREVDGTTRFIAMRYE